MAKLGQPTKYRVKLANEICSRIACGESMRSISRDESMPAMSTLFDWLTRHKAFEKNYIIAKEQSADVLVDDMLDIADNQVAQPVIFKGKPVKVKGKVVMCVDSASVAHAKLKCDVRKFAASKLKPKKYGEKITNEHTGADGGAIETVTRVERVIVDPTNTNS